MHFGNLSAPTILTTCTSPPLQMKHPKKGEDAVEFQPPSMLAATRITCRHSAFARRPAPRTYSARSLSPHCRSALRYPGADVEAVLARQWCATADPGAAAAKLDFTNAFNSAHRGAVFAAVAEATAS
jgi:hypothetical protein